jgi:hypothetical protein
MRTIVTEKTVYSWDDVVNTPELLEKAIEKNRDINTGMGDDWWSMTYDDWTEKLESLGYRDIDICFSGFWSQGDGASFTGNVDTLLWIEVNDTAGKYKRIYNLLKANRIEVDDNRIIRDRWTNHVHWNTTSLYFEIEYYFGACLDYKNIDALTDQLESDIFEHHVDLNKEIYRSLEETYDYLKSDQAVVDTLAANEYDFDSEGNIY